MILDDICGFNPNCIQGAHGNPLSSFKLEVVASQGDATGLRDMQAGPLQNHSANKRLHAEDKCKESKAQTENDPATTSAMQSCGKHMNRNESMRPRHSAKQSSRRHSRTFVQVKQDQKHS